MTYVMGDIHGNLRRFRSILDQIGLTGEDTLYVLGDVVDRYPSGIEILRTVMDMPNARMLLGNHEYMMMAVWSPWEGVVDPKARARWERNGCAPTNAALEKLTGEERERIFRFVAGLPLSFDVEAGGRRFKLVHAALPQWYDPAVEDKYGDAREFAVWKRYTDFSWLKDEPYTLVFGHTPTCHYQQTAPQRIWKRDNVIGVDCGAGYEEGSPEGFRLACLRLEDLKEFYSEEPR